MREYYLLDSLEIPSFQHSKNNYTTSQLHQVLLPMLLDLEFVDQSPRYHPEGNALYHSLQVFALAYKDSNDPELWAAALFHDVGKAIDQPNHDKVGAQMLAGLLPDRVIWLVLFHLDLLKHPTRTRKKLQGTSQLSDLEKLRRWDLGGRQRDIEVVDPNTALNIVLNGLESH